MKKVLLITLVLVLALSSGCTKEPLLTETVPETTISETIVPETTEETIPVPHLTYGIAEVDGVPAIISLRMRGDVVDIVDSYDEKHYVIKTEQGYGLVEKNLVRTADTVAYEAWTGYAQYNAELYDNFYLTGEPMQKLATNTKMEVLDDLGYCYVVKVDHIPGFVRTESVSKWQIQPYGGGDSGGGISGGGQSGGADGGDIYLQYQGSVVFLSAIHQEGEVSGQATVLADNTPVILGFFDRNDEIPVVAEDGFAEPWDNHVVAYMGGLYAYVPENLLRMEGDMAYEQWDGYSRYNTPVYDNYYLMGSPVDKLNTNTQVRVLHELENCYMVETDELTGFVEKDNVSETKIYTGGGGYDNGGSYGGAGGGGGGEEWSPPAL